MMKPRRILIVPDKFKGSATAVEVAQCLSTLVRRRAVGGGDAVIKALPMADGGDGSLSVLATALGSSGRIVTVPTVDSLMRPIDAPLLLFDNGHSAFIEMASVCGLAMLEVAERNPEKTTTYGLGLMIVRSIEAGARKIVIGIGGSSTNDCGEGMVRAVAGSRFACALLKHLSSEEIALFAGDCHSFSGDCRSFPCDYADSAGAVRDDASSLRVHTSSDLPSDAVSECSVEEDIEILVACDVNNPLLGPDGATFVYGPQKGADAGMLVRLEKRNADFASRWGIDSELPGGGAAGGVGAALSHFFGASLVPGWRLFSDIVHLEEAVASSDIVLTAEGRFDSQSMSGKLIDGVASVCRSYSRPLDVFCGQSLLKSTSYKGSGICNVFTLMEVEPDRKRSIENVKSLLSGDGLLVAGCDEAGRGSLAGSVFAAAVILPENFYHPLLTDSKKLTAAQREMLRSIIEKEALCWCVAQVSAAEIDRINILKASILAMHRALDGLSVTPQVILVDGNRFEPYRRIPFHCLVKGDSRAASIAAASILAKTHRDEYMKRLAVEHPQYGWDRNMAYPTEEHREAIRKWGVTPYHRLSYNLLPDDGTLF